MTDSCLNLALEAWRAGAELRRRRKRFKDYTYGRQWGDLVTGPDGRTVSEEQLAGESGFSPMSNNLIRQLVKCVVGNFRASLADSDPASEDAPVDADTSRRNLLTELDCRMLEEFLISGCAVQRVVAEKRMAGEGVWVDNVSPDSFFINRFTDPRGLDIELVGMLHSMSLREVMMRFAPEGGRRAAAVGEAYRTVGSSPAASIGDSVSRSFFEAEPGRCRVIEVWTLESRSVLRCHDTADGSFRLLPATEAGALERENRRRRRASQPEISFRRSHTLRWHCRFYAPTGLVLDEYDSPYAHGLHPFAVKFYPLIDGEVHSLVEDIIDQQRYVNRLITLIDHIMSVSAKGALLVPQGCIPHGQTVESISRIWARPGSVITYNAAKGEPRQVSASSDNSGAYRLLELQMDLFSRISGVSGALQGQITNAHTSAALYDSQVQHSAVAILDLIQTFHGFRQMRNALVNRI